MDGFTLFLDIMSALVSPITSFSRALHSTMIWEGRRPCYVIASHGCHEVLCGIDCIAWGCGTIRCSFGVFASWKAQFASRRIRLLYHFPSPLLFHCTFSPIRVIGGAIGMSLACTRFPQIPRLFRVLLDCECYIICILGRYWKGRVHIDGPRFFWSALIIG